MKRLEDLKQEILNKQINNFYVFYGEDYGIRKHYINKISEEFSKVSYVDSYEEISNLTVSKSLFSTKRLIVVYNDLEFLKLSKDEIETFIRRLTDYCAIFVYEISYDSSALWKNFQDYITYFPEVQPSVAKEFVEDELTLSSSDEDELVYNCRNNYNNILLESDKIKNYGQNKNLSDQNAYESLYSKNQLLLEFEEFSCNDIMNDILQGNFSNLGYWSYLIKEKYEDRFFISLISIFNDYIIAYFVKRYGKWDGGNRAYNYTLPWGRIKTIRDFNIPYDYNYLLDCAYKISSMDILIKTGKLDKSELIDYFISCII